MGGVADAFSFDPTRAMHAMSAWGAGTTEYALNGDVIWKDAAGINNLGNTKPHAKVAFLAMEDLWLAFLRARATPTQAGALVDGIIKKWMTISADPTNAKVPANCMKQASLEGKDLADNERRVEKLRAACLKVTGLNRELPNKPAYDWHVVGANWPDADLAEHIHSDVGKAEVKTEALWKALIHKL